MSTRRNKNWLCLIRRLIFSDHHQPHHHHPQKRTQRRRWLFGTLKITKGLPPPPASPSPLPEPPEAAVVQTAKVEAEEKQSKWEEDVGKPISQWKEEVPNPSEGIASTNDVVLLNNQHENDVESLAALKIQNAYRGYLARKALRALKGFVRLQAIIRGRAVRRQAMTTFKSLQAIVNIQSRICSKRGQLTHPCYTMTDFQQGQKLKMETPRHRRLDDGLLPKKEEIDIILRKQEAILRRQKNKPYSFNHRSSTDSEDSKAEGQLKYWLDHYIKDQAHPIKTPNLRPNPPKPNHQASLHNLSLQSRRSFHTHRSSASETRSYTGIPAYMVATESARAKARSSSTPRLSRVLVDRAYSDGDSPYKQKLISPMSSTRSEMTSSGITITRGSNNKPNIQQKSPCLKGLHGSDRLNYRKMKDVGLEYQ